MSAAVTTVPLRMMVSRGVRGRIVIVRAVMLRSVADVGLLKKTAGEGL
jgi:hypothetical protein